MAAQACKSCQASSYPESFPEWRQILGAVVTAVKLFLIVFGAPALWLTRASSFVSIRQPALSLVVAAGALFNLHIPLRELLGEGRFPCVVYLGASYMFIATFGFGLALRFLRIRVLHRMQNRVRRLMDVKKEPPAPMIPTDRPGLDENGSNLLFLLGMTGEMGRFFDAPSEAPVSPTFAPRDTPRMTGADGEEGNVVEHTRTETRDWTDATPRLPSQPGTHAMPHAGVVEKGQGEHLRSQLTPTTSAPDEQYVQTSTRSGVSFHDSVSRVVPAGISRLDVASHAASRPESMQESAQIGTGAATRTGASGDSNISNVGPAPKARKRRRCKLPPLHTQKAQLQAIGLFVLFTLGLLGIRLLAFADAVDVKHLTSIRYGCNHNAFDYFWMALFCVWFIFVLVALLRTIRTQQDDFGLKTELHLFIVASPILLIIAFLGSVDSRLHREWLKTEYALIILDFILTVSILWLPPYTAYTDARWKGELQRREELDVDMDGRRKASTGLFCRLFFRSRPGPSSASATADPALPIVFDAHSGVAPEGVRQLRTESSAAAGNGPASLKLLDSRSSSHIPKTSSRCVAQSSPQSSGAGGYARGQRADTDVGPASQLRMPGMAGTAGHVPLLAHEGDDASQAGGSFESLHPPHPDLSSGRGQAVLQVDHRQGQESFTRESAATNAATGLRLVAYRSDLQHSNPSVACPEEHAAGSINGSILFMDAWREVGAAQGQTQLVSTLLSRKRSASNAAGPTSTSVLRSHDSAAESGSFYMHISALDDAALQRLVLPDGGPPLPRPIRDVAATALLSKAPGSLNAADLQVVAYHLIYTADGRAHFAPLLQREFCLENLLFLMDALTYRRYVYDQLKVALHKRAARSRAAHHGHAVYQHEQAGGSFDSLQGSLHIINHLGASGVGEAADVPLLRPMPAGASGSPVTSSSSHTPTAGEVTTRAGDASTGLPTGSHEDAGRSGGDQLPAMAASHDTPADRAGRHTQTLAEEPVIPGDGHEHDARKHRDRASSSVRGAEAAAAAVGTTVRDRSHSHAAGGADGRGLKIHSPSHIQPQEDRLISLLPARARLSSVRYANRLWERYIDPRADMCVNLPARMVAKIKHDLSATRPALTLFFEAEREILSLLIRGPVPRFVVSPGWHTWQEELKSQAAFQAMFDMLRQLTEAARARPPVPEPGLASANDSTWLGETGRRGSMKVRQVTQSVFDTFQRLVSVPLSARPGMPESTAGTGLEAGASASSASAVGASAVGTVLRSGTPRVAPGSA